MPKSSKTALLALVLACVTVAPLRAAVDLLPDEPGGESLCPAAILDLTLEGASQLGVMVYSPCHAGQSVVLDHAGLALTGKVSAVGGVHATLPLIDATVPVTVTFADGMIAEALLPAPALRGTKEAAARF